MKLGQKSMNRNLVLALAALALSACNTGDVQVSGSGSNAASPNQLPGQALTPTSTQNQGDSSSSGDPGAKEEDRIAFFQRITMNDDGLPDQVRAVAYASKSASKSSFFGIPLAEQHFNPAAALIPSSDDKSVTYLRSMDVGVDAIVTTDLSSQDTKTRLRFPHGVKAFSIRGEESLPQDASTWVVAWIDDTGAVSVGENLNSNISTLTLPTALTSKQPKSLKWNSAGDRLLVRTDSDAVLYKVGAQGLSFDRVYFGASASAFDPAGSKLAVVQVKDSTLDVIDLASAVSQQEKAPIALESPLVHDFSWNDRGFTYWARLKSGLSEVRFISYKSDQVKPETDTKFAKGEITIAQLGISDAVGDGVVCPSWSGDGIYYSDLDNGTYVVERSTLNSGSGGTSGKFTEATEFMRPLFDTTDTEGFVCPKF